MPNTFEVKKREHFKLLIDFKDNIIFENELIKKNIDYYRDEKSIIYFRYYFLEFDSEVIDSILKKTNIIALTETLPIQNFEVEKKVQKLYLKVIVISIIILFLIEFIYKCFKK